MTMVRIAPGVKTRPHHNTSGTRQVRRGKTAKQVEAMCRRLGLPFRHGRQEVATEAEEGPETRP